jgi:hypothetical protein
VSTQIVLKSGEGKWWFKAKRRVLSWEHGYLWIGNDDPNDMACYATLDEDDAERVAKKILAHIEKRRRVSPKETK